MPATGAEGNLPLADRAAAMLLRDSIAAVLAALGQLPSLF
jgi:hypothetical protein